VLLAAAAQSSTMLCKRAARTTNDLMPYTAWPWKEPAACKHPKAHEAADKQTQTHTKPASCMTTLTFAAGADPNAMLLELKMLLSVACTSDHLVPSVLTLTVKDLAGNSH